MSDELTVAQVAERLGVGRSTVNLWCRQGRFSRARVEVSPVGDYWLIPVTDLKDFQPPKRGRIPKDKSDKPATIPADPNVKSVKEAILKSAAKKGGKK
jgi:excisionase family DNA binding protein